MRALVVGGGIGGIAAAAALAQRGIEVRVYEQAPRLATELNLNGRSNDWTFRL